MDWFGDDYVDRDGPIAAWKQMAQGGHTIAGLLDHFASVVCPARVKAKTCARALRATTCTISMC